MASLVLNGVGKKYGPLEVVKNVTLEVEDGAFVVLVGPSGCGKSTILRMIAGLEAISEGTLKIGDTVVNELPPRDRDVAMVFQNYALYPHMTVRDNISFGLKLRKMPKAEIRKRVDEAARTLGLEELLDRRPKQLSGGQRQRVAMGRAIVRQPAVFLFDEPLSNLDAKLRGQMRAEIAQLQRRLGTTTVYVTHDQVEAMTLATHIVVLSKGEVQQVGAPMELYRYPANTFVAAFIGSPSMNLFSVTLRDDREVLEGKGVRCSVPEHLAADLGESARSLVLGVRPEHLYEASTDAETVMTGTVDVLEPLGSEINVLGRVEGQNFTATLDPNTEVKVGQTVRLALHHEHLHLFDAASGASIRGSTQSEAA